ncbi:MAG: hypothetical protein IID36_08575 [Planctomycetes bacterium]|nr:hypothetical protein [Planctomycetota bacterium]
MKDLVRQMHILRPSEFKSRLDAIKKEYADTTLGKTYDRNRHLAALRPVAQSFRKVYTRIRGAVMREDRSVLSAIRRDIPAEELRLFSSMCLALTTKENRDLCAQPPRSNSDAGDVPFRIAYDGAATLLRAGVDARRAKFRKLVLPETLVDLAELCNSIATDDCVRAYKQRARISIAL